MKWSEYDLLLRAWCLKHDKPIPGRPEAEYGVNWTSNPFNNGTPREYKTWGSSLQVLVRLSDCSSAEDYWEKVRAKAAENLDKLVASRN